MWMLECMMVHSFFDSILTNFLESPSPAVRVEWCKAWARSRRWMEEVYLLQEEMRRVVASHEYKAAWWREHRNGLGCKWPSMIHAEGGHAYASKHAALHESLISHCRLVWAQKRKLSPQDVAAVQEKASIVSPIHNDIVESDASEDVVEDVEADGFVW
jgi:hypothetical protein